jgi:hypothetical protein
MPPAGTERVLQPSSDGTAPIGCLLADRMAECHVITLLEVWRHYHMMPPTAGSDNISMCCRFPQFTL